MWLSKQVSGINERFSRTCKRFTSGAPFIVAGLLIAPFSYAHHHEAEEQHEGHNHHEEASQQHANDPAVAAYQAANDKMHEDMAMSFTGNPDVDFAKGMIPHHEGAIAMAEIVLQYGEDEKIRQLAEEIIAAQESEIAFLKEWLDEKRH
ncbi:hypothetical protein LCGC14_0035820 [marine sediment metagenome]|uniref:DUF305 domain-containing protein n=1 Tax=marine sediment metagenome TaxID=412755 RepID=A0A0F9VVZ6_9ZZZZ|nr:DUF305 domain-containing protein [Halomonas sp.]